jgi:hypothetical protein
LDEIGDSYGLERDIDVTLDVGIDWNEVVFAFELRSEAGEIDNSDRIRSRR